METGFHTHRSPALRSAWLAIAVLAALTTTLAAATRAVADALPTQIVFTCPVPPGSEAEEVMTSLYKPVFDQLHIEFRLLPLPPLREAMELEKGTYDGTCGRTSSPELNHNPHYVRLNHPITRFSLTFFATRPIGNIHSIRDLPAGSRVLYMSGSVSIEAQLKDLGEVELIAATSPDSAFRMLAAGRADVFITGHRRPRDHQEKDRGRYRHPGIHQDFYTLFQWDYQGLYPYLHKRHLNLKTALEAEIDHQLQDYPEGQLALPAER